MKKKSIIHCKGQRLKDLGNGNYNDLQFWLDSQFHLLISDKFYFNLAILLPYFYIEFLLSHWHFMFMGALRGFYYTL